jgi:hypothetical protein
MQSTNPGSNGSLMLHWLEALHEAILVHGGPEIRTFDPSAPPRKGALALEISSIAAPP